MRYDSQGRILIDKYKRIIFIFAIVTYTYIIIPNESICYILARISLRCVCIRFPCLEN